MPKQSTSDPSSLIAFVDSQHPQFDDRNGRRKPRRRFRSFEKFPGNGKSVERVEGCKILFTIQEKIRPAVVPLDPLP
jgi:hypothetical protein